VSAASKSKKGMLNLKKRYVFLHIQDPYPDPVPDQDPTWSKLKIPRSGSETLLSPLLAVEN